MHYTKTQVEALNAFIQVYTHPTKKQREELGEKIGLNHLQIYYWSKRYQYAHGIQPEEQVIAELLRKNEELMSTNKELLNQNEELHVQNKNLINALHNINCPQCGGPVPHSDVQRSRLEVVPPQPEPLLELSDGSIDLDHLRRDVQNLMPTLIERSSLHVPSENHPGPSHDLVGVHTDLIADIVRKAKDELLLLATAGFPLWISSPSPTISIQPEILNREEYLQVFQ